jgi:hypothetical protein
LSPPEERSVEFSVPMTKDQLVGLLGTYSGIITLEADRRAEFSRRVRAFLDRQPWDRVDLPLICRCLRSTRLPDVSCDHGRMTAWRDVEQAEPEFAQRVRALFDAHRHKTIATLRADGSPRISGIEAAFEDGELVFGSMANARKGADLRRDPRFALHSATVDPVEGAEAQWPGEAKISGRALAAGPITEGPDGDRFQADIAEVVHTHLNAEATMLVVEWWTPRRGCAGPNASDP